MSSRVREAVPGSRRAEPNIVTGASPRRVGYFAAACLIAAAALTGRHVVDEALVRPARNTGYSDGICAALEMAVAHGALNDVTYRKVLKAMTTMYSPEYDGYAVSHRDLLQACRRVRDGSDVSRATPR